MLVAGGIVTFSFVSASAPIGFASGTWSVLLAGAERTVDVDPALDGLRFSTAAIVEALVPPIGETGGATGLKRPGRVAAVEPPRPTSLVIHLITSAGV